MHTLTKLSSVQEARGYLRGKGVREDGMADGEIAAYCRTRFGSAVDVSAFAPVTLAAAAPAVRAVGREYRIDSPTALHATPRTDAVVTGAVKRRDVRQDAFLSSFQQPGETADQYHQRMGLTGGDMRDAAHPQGGGKAKDPRRAAYEASWSK